MQTSGRVEYMFINVGEDIEIKLTAQHFRKLSSRDNTCVMDDEYSAIDCEERCFWRHATNGPNCRGPWMPGIDLPLCNNYTQIKNLIIRYRKYGPLSALF